MSIRFIKMKANNTVFAAYGDEKIHPLYQTANDVSPAENKDG